MFRASHPFWDRSWTASSTGSPCGGYARTQASYDQPGSSATRNPPAGYRPSLAVLRALLRGPDGLDELDVYQLRRFDLIDRGGRLTDLGRSALVRARDQFNMTEPHRG